MDILTTGQTKTSSERLQALTEFIISVQREFRDRVLIHGLKYGNLYDFLLQKAQDGQIKGLEDKRFTEKEFREALGVLEDENKITLNGH